MSERPVLVLRPDRQAAATARKLSRLGFRPILAPILHVEPTGDTPPAGPFDALVVTSRSAVRPLAAVIDHFPGLPVFAVGARSGAALEAAGLPDVRAAAGSGPDLARLIAQTLPAGAVLLHVAGRHRKPEPGATLAAAGFRVAVWESYAAEPVDTLPDEAADALRAGNIACLHYSKRSAGTFVRLAGAAGLLGPLADATHLCLSDDVAFPLKAVGAMRIAVAAEPNEPALFDALSGTDDPDGVRPDSIRPDGARPDRGRVGSRPDRSGWYGRNESSAARLPGRSRTPAPMTETSREKRRKDPYSRKAPTIELPAEDFTRAERADTNPGTVPPDAETVAAVETAGPVTEPVVSPVDPASDAAVTEPAGHEPAVLAETVVSAETAEAWRPVLPDTAEGEVPVGTEPWPTPSISADAKTTEPGEATDMTAPAVPGPTDVAEPTPASKEPDAFSAAELLGAERVVSETARPSLVPNVGTIKRDDTTSPAGGTAPPASPPPRRGAGSLIGSGLLGGVIGAALAAGATYATRPDTDALAGRLSALERRPAATIPAATTPPLAFDRGALDALAGRLAALETATKPLADGIAAVRGTAETADTTARQAADAAAKLGALPPDPAVTNELGELSKRLAALDEMARNAATAGAVSALAGQIAPLQESARLGSVNAGAITDLRSRFDTLQADAQARSQASAGTLSALQSKAGDLDTRLAGLAAEQAKLPPALMGAGLKIVAAGQASDALRTGQPLGAALAALAKLGVPAARLAPLQTFATAAPPTAGQLAAEFRPLAERLVSEPTRPADSVTDRLLRMADKIVTVRQVGDGSGTDVPGIVGRIEAALGRGALADAASAWDGLPEAARTASAAWGAKLKGRAAADEASRAIAAESLGALDAPMR